MNVVLQLSNNMNVIIEQKQKKKKKKKKKTKKNKCGNESLAVEFYLAVSLFSSSLLLSDTE